jgi:hypothetical protein
MGLRHRNGGPVVIEGGPSVIDGLSRSKLPWEGRRGQAELEHNRTRRGRERDMATKTRKPKARRARSQTKKLGSTKWRVTRAAGSSGGVTAASGGTPKAMGTGIMFQESCRAFSRQGKGAPKKYDKSLIEFVLREAARHSEPYYQHVIAEYGQAEQAEFIDIGEGCLRSIADVEEFMKWLKAAMAMQEETYRKPDGTMGARPLRRTTTVLGTAMVSWPEDPGTARDNPVSREWLARTIEFARERYGDKLVACIAHHDEGKFHCHLFFHNDGANVKSMLAAYKEVAAWEAEPDFDGTGGGEAAKRGNRKLLKAFHEKVGVHVGLDLKGPNPGQSSENWRKRKKREAKEKQEQAEADRLAAAKASRQAKEELAQAEVERRAAETAREEASQLKTFRVEQAGATIRYIRKSRQQAQRQEERAQLLVDQGKLDPALFEDMFGKAPKIDDGGSGGGQGAGSMAPRPRPGLH